MPEATLADYEADKAAGFPGYQQQQLVDIFNRAKTYDQAQKDVAAARAMMGSVRVQQAIAKGTDPAAAYYSNINYFVNDKNLAPVMNALRPVPPPYATNFPGMSAPVVIAPTRSGQTVRFPPASALPQPPPPQRISAIPIINVDGTTNQNLVATPAAGGKGVVVHSMKTPQEGSLTEVQKARLRELDIADREARNPSFIGEREKALEQIKAERAMIYRGNKTEKLTREKAMEFLDQANGDKEKARALARENGYQF